MILKDIKRRPLAAIAMICLVGLGLSLGIWQLNRASQKEALANSLAAKEMAQPLVANEKSWTLNEALHHRMVAKGSYLPERSIWLENRPHPKGRDPVTGIATGFFLLTPLRLSGSNAIVWVNRGWAPRSFDQLNKVPEVITPEGNTEVIGVVFDAAGKTYQLGKESGGLASDGRVIQENLDLGQLAKTFEAEQMPFVLREDTNSVKDGLQRLWSSPETGVEKHLGYAFQWFALALMSFVFWIVTGLRANRQSLR